MSTVPRGRTAAAPPAARRRGQIITLRVLLAVSFAAGELLKFGGAHPMVDLFTKIGAGQWYAAPGQAATW